MSALSDRTFGKAAATLAERICCFWTMPVTPWPLAWFRIGLSGVLLAQALSLLGHLDELYGHHDVADRSVNLGNSPPAITDLEWIERELGLAVIPASAALPLIFAGYVGSLAALLFGYHTRFAAGLACFFHMGICSSNSISCYGVDRFAQIGLFYCFLFPVGQVLSVERVPLGSEHTYSVWLGLRVLQLHVCIAYTASGIEKGLGEQWWNGEAIWRAVMSAPLDGPIDCSFLASLPWLARGACLTTLVLEAGIVAFVWHPRLRQLWLVGIVGMHLGIAALLSLWTFSATMIVFDIAAFGGRRDGKIRCSSIRGTLWKYVRALSVDDAKTVPARGVQ
jgi:hypothetical protein